MNLEKVPKNIFNSLLVSFKNLQKRSKVPKRFQILEFFGTGSNVDRALVIADRVPKTSEKYNCLIVS